MPRRLDYTDAALRDIEAAFQWLSQPGSGTRARRRIRAIRTAIDTLIDHPCLHPVNPDSRRRELSCEGHRIIYSVVPDTGDNATAGNVVVLRVFGPGQIR